MNIDVELSVKSIESAIKQIEEYERRLNAKTHELVKRLSEIGINTINVTMMSVAPVDRGEYETDIVWNEQGNGIEGALVFLKGDKILFIEFSSGITFGTSSFPSLPNNPSYGSGMGMGTYPDGKGHWNDPEGWWYRGKWGEPEHSYGVRAYAPMYHAAVDMRNQINAIANEVFRS